MKYSIKAIIIATMLVTLAAFAFGAPANDNWADATLILPGTLSLNGSLTGAGVQPCEPANHVFPDEGQMQAKKTVWYKWQAPSNGSFTFWASGNGSLDTTLSVYRFSLGLCNGNITQIPYPMIENHNHNVDLGFTGPSKVSFRAIAGETIYLAVDSYNNIDGDFLMGVEKTRFRYDVSLDYKNGGADLVIDRNTPSGREWWMARFGTQSYFATQTGMLFGAVDDQTFMADYDGDAVSDLVAVRKVQGTLYWYISTRTGQMIKTVQWGLDTDKPIIGDYDGDGMADITVTRDDVTTGKKVWHILRSKDGQYMGLEFGIPGDREMAGDYDGDSKTDLVALRNENGAFRWYILHSSTNAVVNRVFGYATGGDIPVVVNFDPDFKTDIAVFRTSNTINLEWNGYWFSIDSSSPLPLDQRPIRYQQFGQSNDRPQPADYDGDLRTDLAVVRGGVWWIRHSLGNGAVEAHQWGYASDRPLTDGGNYVSQVFY